MLDVMYELPDQEEGTKYVLDGDAVLRRKSIVKIPPAQAKSA